MFSGLVRDVGIVHTIHKTSDCSTIQIQTSNDIITHLNLGDSIAINGVCQTVVNITQNIFTVQSTSETLQVTNLRLLASQMAVNLEYALTLSDKLGGHLVQGHVDDVAPIKSIQEYKHYWNVFITYISPYIFPKGSISIDGISLTVHELKDSSFRIQLIPETLKRTAVIQQWKEGYLVNLEMDYILKGICHYQTYKHHTV